MSVTMSADAHTHMTNHINALGKEVWELKKQNKVLSEAHTKTLKRRNWDQSERDKLRKENKELKASAQTTENYWKSKFENAQDEIESLKKSNKQKTKMIHKFREQVKGLDKVMLSSAFQSWREVQCATNPQYTIQDEIDFLNGETTNQELINEVFEDLYAGEYEYDMKNKTYTEIEEEEDYTHGVSIDCEDAEEEQLFHSYEEAEKYYEGHRLSNLGDIRSGKTKIYFYSVPEEYDGGCESFKDGWIIRATEPEETYEEFEAKLDSVCSRINPKPLPDHILKNMKIPKKK